MGAYIADIVVADTIIVELKSVNKLNEVMKIHTKFQDEGISKRTITLEDQKKLMLEGKEIEEINFEGTEIEKTVINKGTNALIVKEFMEESIKDPNCVLPGKTIFFCSTVSHARRIEQIFDSLYPEYKGELAKVLVSDDPRVYGKGGLLAQFKKTCWKHRSPSSQAKIKNTRRSRTISSSS